ncbi:hypothetical protein H5410_044476 [Solanum commersonii]|uniref:Helitron helicase-like domain-containing protein n=1 Tax=Solanum commersonii TaxID=4109 RepID=A0A9J5X867_SOLCO|nr:hypothetical protein H5410_044476 [Solanum commersonii]
MYTIEFQKQGLPHAHFLIILMDRYKLLTPQSYDKIVCAELPDPHIDHHLYKLVTKHMIHEFFLMNKMNNDAINLNLLYKEFPQHFVWSSSYKMWSRRKQRLTIGRIVTCHPIEGERYYLRLLLMNIRGPKSYEALRTVDEKCYTTFREAAEKKAYYILITT